MKTMMVISQKKTESELRESKNRFKKMKNSEGSWRETILTQTERDMFDKTFQELLIGLVGENIDFYNKLSEKKKNSFVKDRLYQNYSRTFDNPDQRDFTVGNMSLTKKQFFEKIEELEEILKFEYEICKKITRDFLESELENSFGSSFLLKILRILMVTMRKKIMILFLEIKNKLEDLSEKSNQDQ